MIFHLLSADKFLQEIPEHLTNECIAQSWFRFLQLLSDPVDLSRPHVVSNTAKFMHMALTAEVVMEPHQHPCLQKLPHIFRRAMRSISVLVDSFLGEVCNIILLSIIILHILTCFMFPSCKYI